MNDATQTSRAGSHFGRYYLKRLLGRGGMGEVYEAEDTVKERSVALKLLSPVLCQDPVFRERLQREARTAGRLLEPHVVPVHDYGEIDGLLFLEMRLIDGKDLSALLKESGVLTPPRAVAIVRQAASALDAAHAAGVIHRDIKPENILITSDDFAYLVDFGIASATTDEKLTSVGSAVGTWKYAAPERFTEGEVTHSIDVYALACVLHECLTGAPPYRADSAGMLITAHLMNEIPQPSEIRPGIPTAFDRVIARGMAKDPAVRYASAGELAQAATDALSAQDQDRADEIVERGEEATLPEPDYGPSPLAAGVPAPHQHPPGPTSPPPYAGAWPGPPQPAPQRPDGPLAPHAFPPAGTRPGQFRPPPPISPYRRPPRRGRGPVVVAALVATVVIGGLLIWAAPSGSPPRPATGKTPPVAERTATPPPPAVSTPPPAESQARLFGSIPAGYPPGACNPVTTPPHAFARLACAQNVDPDGPPSATYTLYPNLATLRTAFNEIVQTSAVLECPGRIQSPGAWHRIASPTQISGMLMCGLQHGSPTVAWTNDAALVLGSVQSDPPGPNFDQLYGWWASHS